MEARSILQEHVYRELSAYLSLHQEEVVEIEILPSLPAENDKVDTLPAPDSIFLQDGLCIGIPKKMLVLAYLESRKLFFSGMKDDDTASQVAYEATRIMLLFDPEHITAANFRKRRLMRLKETGEGREGDISFLEACNTEMAFLNSILTSPLHRQSKSPTLWHHRAWLLDLLLPVRRAAVPTHQNSAFVLAELDAVCQAGERHPKNYYAWQYARKLITKALQGDRCQTHPRSNGSPHPLALTCALRVKTWCCKHPSDMSGWSFLHFFLPLVATIPARTELVDQVLDYAFNLHWEQESLWNFIRAVLADATLHEQRDVLIQKLHDYSEVGAFQTCIIHSVKWIERFKTPLPMFKDHNTFQI
jgi:hypothetical protein